VGVEPTRPVPFAPLFEREVGHHQHALLVTPAPCALEGKRAWRIIATRRRPYSSRDSKLGRTTLVQCTLIAKRYSPYLQRFYERIKKKRGSGKAIIATARKFLGIIYRTLKHNWVFADFPNFALAKS